MAANVPNMTSTAESGQRKAVTLVTRRKADRDERATYR